MNPWIRLRSLIDCRPLLTDMVTALNADGTSSVSLTGGGSIRVLNQNFSVNDYVLVRGNEIIGIAPALPSYNLTV